MKRNLQWIKCIRFQSTTVNNMLWFKRKNGTLEKFGKCNKTCFKYCIVFILSLASLEYSNKRFSCCWNLIGNYFIIKLNALKNNQYYVGISKI